MNMNGNDTSYPDEKDPMIERLYQEEYGHIRTPQALKEETLKRMLAKNEEIGRKQDSVNDTATGKVIPFHSRWNAFMADKSPSFVRMAATAAAFALIIIGVFVSSGLRKDLPAVRTNGLPSDYSALYQAAGEITVNEDLSGMQKEWLPDRFYTFKKEISKSYTVRTEPEKVIDEITKTVYEDEEATLTILASKNQELAPSELYSKAPRQIAGIPVYLARSETPHAYYAAWTDDIYLYVAYYENGKEEDFIKALEALLEGG